MRRRQYIVLAAISLAGCTGAGGDSEGGRPDECPVDRLSGWGPPPEDLDRRAAETFVQGYEKAYVEATEIDHQRYDRVDGPGTNVIDSEPVDDGYIVHVETSWALWRQEDDELVFEAVAGSVRDPVPADHEAIAEIPDLQQHLERAAEGDRSNVLRESHGSYEETYAGIAEAAGDVDGAVIEYDDQLIEVTERNGPEIHGDGYARSKYFVAPGVLYRSGHDRDPREGVLLEC